jgi:hypothetical protein
VASEHNKEKGATSFNKRLQHRGALSKNGSKTVNNNQAPRKKFVPIFTEFKNN